MSFKFKQASCVVVGTFNIYVFQPSFLAQMGLLTEAKPKFEQDFSQPGFRVTFQSPLPTRWLVRPDRVMVTTNDPEADCGSPMAKIIENLPWTPMTALGMNFEFQASHDDFAKMSCRNLLPVVSTEQTVLQKTVHLAVAQLPQVLNLSISELAETVDLDFNIHTEINAASSGATTRREQAAFAADIAKRFEEFRTKSTSLSHELFGVDVNYAKNSDPT